jgi:hypothetical protein
VILTGDSGQRDADGGEANRMNQAWVHGLAIVAAAIALLLGLVELGLRWLFGFGNPLIYQADPDIGYLLTPNQSTRRFGHQIEINQYCMRSAAIAPTRSSGTLRILMIGDSIVNGAWWTDQNATLSALLQQRLQQSITGFDRIEVLNASANSWAPRNELAYLQRFGTFDAQVIVQIINTDDLFGIEPNSLVVGRDRNYPDRKPVSAISEVLSRQLKQPPIPELEQLWQAEGDRVGQNLEAIQQIQAIALQNQAELLLAITPLKRELTSLRDYEAKARQRLQALTQQQQIAWIDFLPLFQLHPNPSALYRDTIHLSASGNEQVIVQLQQQIEASLQAKQQPNGAQE